MRAAVGRQQPGTWRFTCQCAYSSRAYLTQPRALQAALEHIKRRHPITMAKDRQRCMTPYCNPKLWSVEQAEQHTAKTGHSTAAWPKRSEEGKRRESERNRSGYHAKYRRHTFPASVAGAWVDIHPHEPDALGQS